MNQGTLAALFEKLGARDPDGWARSQLQEQVAQLARFLFLRQAWRAIVDEGDSAWIEVDPIVQIAGAIAFARNRRVPTTSGRRTLVVVASALLAVASIFVSYPLDSSHRILGFPFMAAAFEKHGARWEDFVGPLTLPAYVGKVIFAFMLPQTVILLWRWRARRPTSC